MIQIICYISHNLVMICTVCLPHKSWNICIYIYVQAATRLNIYLYLFIQYLPAFSNHYINARAWLISNYTSLYSKMLESLQLQPLSVFSLIYWFIVFLSFSFFFFLFLSFLRHRISIFLAYRKCFVIRHHRYN